MNDWEEDDVDSLQVLPKESHTLLPSFQRKEKIKKRLINPVNELNKVVVQQRNKKLIRRYFRFQGLTDMQRKLYNTKNKDRNRDLVNVIKSRFADLQN